MTLISHLTLIHETEETAHYAEDPGTEECCLLGVLSVRKWALAKPTPGAIRLTLEAYEPAPPSPAPVRRRTGRPADQAESSLEKGATVTIVKNRLADIHQPPEWLEQYLGRRGTVLWTTAGGAMVKLDDEATWFPYAELDVDEGGAGVNSASDIP